MHLTLQARLEETWPPSAWLASCRRGEAAIRIQHGCEVEVRDDWFCEAIWDADFEAGDFDATDLVYWSGGRFRGGKMVFVSSGSTVDRLQYRRNGDELFVSNSLACLLTGNGSQLDSRFDDYSEFFRSITKGIDAYQRSLPLQHGTIEFVYYRNLIWNGNELTELDNIDPSRNFSSFEKYRGFLSSALGRIAENMRDGRRRHSYEMVGALSSGYDSTTTTVLASEFGMRQVFSFRNARGGQQDDGEQVARLLGLDITPIERQAWRRQPLSEIPYFAATGLGPDVIFSGASDLLRGRVLITGFHGDKVWGKQTKALGGNLVRGDASGLSFTEHRLMLGTVHLPVAFMGVRDIAQINTLSHAKELHAWDVADEYSRPICRRIVEEAGVPREWFGRKKMAATSLFHKGESRLGPGTERAFHRWLTDARHSAEASAATATRPPARSMVFLRDHYDVVHSLIGLLRRITWSDLAQRLAVLDVAWERAISCRVNPVNMLFPFAIDQLRRAYLPSDPDPAPAAISRLSTSRQRRVATDQRAVASSRPSSGARMLSISPPILVAIGIVATALAQILLKQSSHHAVLTSPWIGFVAVAALSYAFSFLLYALILKHYPLNKVYPAMTVAQIVLITVYGLTIGEAVELRHGIGLLLGVASIYLILT
jgi:multidrug transporter EmrE-like cation transporter